MARAGLDPTVVVGGKVNSLGSNAKLGQGEFLVAEADESDGSFLKLSPVVEVVTNIDLEHLDYYQDLEDIKKTFLKFIDRIPFYGAAVLCLDDENVAELLPKIRKRILTYGMTAQADLYARKVRFTEGRVHFQVCWRGELLGDINLSPPGEHNVYNALAALCVGLELDIDFAVMAQALESFNGVQRRMQHKGEVAGVTVFDDYGHHPTEIRATLAAIKESWPLRRLVVLFQPHRYSRTEQLFKEFQTAFHNADVLFMTDIYAASEQPIAGITSRILLNDIEKYGQRKTYYVAELDQLAREVVNIVKPDDLVLTLGAGSIVRAGEELLRLLERDGDG